VISKVVAEMARARLCLELDKNTTLPSS